MSRNLQTTKMERFPSIPESATHSVNSVSKVALRIKPSYFKTERGLDVDVPIKGEVIDVLSNGTKLIALDEGSGYECNWVNVLVVNKNYGNQKLYIHKDNIRALSTTPASAPYELDDQTNGNPRVPPIVDWTSIEPNVCHFDAHDSKYKVCVELSDYYSTGGDKITERLIEACHVGLKVIFRDNGKKHDDDFVAQYIDDLKNGNIFQFCAAEEYFVDLRPNSFLKVLVTLPKKYLIPVEGMTDTNFVDGVLSTTKWNVLEDVVFKSSFKTNSFEKILKKAAGVLSTYGKQINKFDGTVTDFDAQFESDNLNNVFEPLNKLMRVNGIKSPPWSRDDIIEFGWDNTLTLIYVSLRRGNKSIVFSKGVQELSDTKPYDSQRTMGYLWNLKEIATTDTSQLTWSDFLFAYTLPDPPVINPSKKKDSKNFHENIGNIADKSEPLSKKEAMSFNESPIKTYAEKLLEDKEFESLEKKFNLYQDRVDAYDFVGDYTASCEGIEKTLKGINTFDDAFEKVLDKVNIADLISQCMGQITSGLSNLQDVAEDIGDSVKDLGSGIGINDKTDVSLDYLSDKSKLPSSASLNLEALGSVNFDSLGVCEFSFDKLGLTNLTAESLGIDKIKLNDIPGVDISTIPESSALDSFSIAEGGGVQNFSLEELGLSTTSVKDLGFANLSMCDMGLSGLTFDSLGLSSYDASQLSSKIKEIGVPGANEILDNLGADKIPGVSSVSDAAKNLGIDDSLTKSIDKATEKLDKLKEFPSDPSVITDMFSQGGSPKLPPSLAMTFSDALPTQDIMSDMGETIEFALTTLLNEIFVAMVKNVLKNLNDSCADKDKSDERFGKSNLNEMLDDSIPDGSAGQAGSAEAIDALMDALGMETDTDTNQPTPVGAPTAAPRRQKVVSMLDDVSLLLSPVEICSLINGTANRKTLSLVRSFVAKSYPDIKMNKKSQVLRFFRAFGSMIDPSICRVIESPTPATPSYVVGDILCSPAAEEADRLRETLLSDKGDDITPDQIALQLKRARERKANAAKILADFVNDGPLSDDFAPPPVFCQKGGDGASSTSPDANSASASQKQKGLVDLSHESIDYMTDKAVDLMFDPTYISFSSDVTEYPSAFIKAPDAKEKESVPGDSALAISYYGSPQLDADGKPKENVDIPIGKPKIMPALHSTLLSVETKTNVYGDITPPEELVTDTIYNTGPFVNGATGISIPLPTDVIDLTSLDAIAEDSPDLTDALEKLQGQASSVKWQFNYSEPNRASNISLVDNGMPYDIYLTETNGTDSKIVFNYFSQESVNEQVAATLDQSKYDFSPSLQATSVNLRQHKFASLLTNRIKEMATAEFDASEFFEDSKGFYNEISKDVLAYVTNLIAASPFFKTIEIEKKIPQPPEGEGTAPSQPLHKPVLEFVKLDPEPTLEQRVEGCDPHLLDLKNLKEDLKENMKKERCVDLSAPTDGSPASEMSDQEKEMIKLCIKTIIRTYMIDFYMRGIFSNSVFAPDTQPDDLYIKSVVEFILNDLESYDQPNMVQIGDEIKPVGEYGTYKDDFLAAAYEVSDLYKKPEESGTGPFESDDLGKEAVVSFIEEQYMDVYRLMKQKINSLMLSDIESRFVLEYIPIVNYQGAYVTSGERVFTGLGNLDRSVDWAEGTTVQWGNGNLFLEPYYYLEPHDEAELDTENPESWSSIGVVSKYDLMQVIDSATKPLVDFDNPSEGLYKSVSKGMRLMYSPKKEDGLVTFTSNTSGEKPDDNMIWNSMWQGTQAGLYVEGTRNSYKFSKKRVAMDKCYINFSVTRGVSPASSTVWDWEFTRFLSFPIIDSREVMKKEALDSVVANPVALDPEENLYLLSNHEDFKPFIEFLFPIRRYKSIVEVFCQQATSYDTRINGAMSATKDELRRLFFAINSRGDYRQKDPAMEEIGGAAGLERMMKNEFGLLDTPASPNTWNYNLPLGWGKSVKGLGFEAVAKATGVAIMKILKRQAEKSDPNISIAYKLAMASKLANLNIPTSAWSFMLLPVNVIPFIGIGPPLGPLGFIYHAMGLGQWLNMDGAGGEDAEEIKESLEEAGFAADGNCPSNDFDELYLALTQQPLDLSPSEVSTTLADIDISSLTN